jgi:hypothetical protein
LYYRIDRRITTTGVQEDDAAGSLETSAYSKASNILVDTELFYQFQVSVGRSSCERRSVFGKKAVIIHHEALSFGWRLETHHPLASCTSVHLSHITKGNWHDKFSSSFLLTISR